MQENADITINLRSQSQNISLVSLWPTLILRQCNLVDTIGIILIWSNKGKSKENKGFFIFI